MAIDTSSVSQLIAEFRQLTARDSVTPESLGYLLKCMSALLAEAVSDAERQSLADSVAEVRSLLATQSSRLDDVRSVATVVTSIGKCSCSTSEVSLPVTKSSLKGEAGYIASQPFLSAATSDSAGAMTAEHCRRLATALQDVIRLDALQPVLPLEVVNSLMADDSSKLQSAGYDDIIQWIHGNAGDAYAVVTTDGNGAFQLVVTDIRDHARYWADDWDDIPELGVAALERYRTPSALFVDHAATNVYIHSDDGTSLVRLATEADIADLQQQIDSLRTVTPSTQS